MKNALLIGCNYPNSSISLNGCINDVNNMKKILIEKYNFLQSEIIIMTDDLSSTSYLYPNIKNIQFQILNWVNNSNNSILNYFHYSGHGSSIKDKNSDELDGYDEFIVPSDFLTNKSVILDDEIYKYLENLSNTCPTFLCFDCCLSGTVCDLNYSYSYNTVTKNFFTKMENKNQSLSQKNIISLSAVKDTQYALDVTYNNSNAGAFTSGLISCLSELYYDVPLNTLVSSIYVFLIKNKFNGMSPVLSANKPIDLTKTLFLSNFINNTIATQTPTQPVTQAPTPTQPVSQTPTSTQTPAQTVTQAPTPTQPPTQLPTQPPTQTLTQTQTVTTTASTQPVQEQSQTSQNQETQTDQQQLQSTNQNVTIIRTYIQSQYNAKSISKAELLEIINSLKL